MEWDEAEVALLRKLWAEGLSGQDIGKRFNITKNAVVGKVHRLGLPDRPSPIIRGDGDKPLRIAPVRLVKKPPEIAPENPPIMRVEKYSKSACQFPKGDPRAPGFGYCGQPALLGKPYCPECWETAHVPRGTRRSEAA